MKRRSSLLLIFCNVNRQSTLKHGYNLIPGMVDNNLNNLFIHVLMLYMICPKGAVTHAFVRATHKAGLVLPLTLP